MQFFLVRTQLYYLTDSYMFRLLLAAINIQILRIEQEREKQYSSKFGGDHTFERTEISAQYCSCIVSFLCSWDSLLMASNSI